MNKIELAQFEYEVIPITLEEANNFVKKHHRHHRPTVGHKFSIGLIIKNQRHKLIGVAICGRPIASEAALSGYTLEVNRTCVLENNPNANSKLYSTCAKIARLMGYTKIITYTQDGESGSTFRALGWKDEAHLKPRKGWNSNVYVREDHGNDNIGRIRWAHEL